MAGDGQALLLVEGLRLHLDVQLEPEGTATAPMPAGFSGPPQPAAATERAAPRRRPARAPAAPAYQQWVVLTALASLLLALASWWVGGEPAQPAPEPTELSSNMSSEPEPAAPPHIAPAAAAAPASDPAVVVVPLLAPAPAAAAPGPAPARPATAVSGTPRPPPAPGSRQRPPASQHAAPGSEPARAPRATAGGEEARAAAPRLANTDLLYLFGDTK